MSIFERLRMGVCCATAEQTIDLGHELALALPPDQILALSGDLGAGKTTFCKGVGRGLGIPVNQITSPTYTIYTLHEGRMRFLHMDLYRLSSREEVEDLLLEDWLLTPWIMAVEWAERGLPEWMAANRWNLRFESHRNGEVVIQCEHDPLAHG